MATIKCIVFDLYDTLMYIDGSRSFTRLLFNLCNKLDVYRYMKEDFFLTSFKNFTADEQTALKHALEIELANVKLFPEAIEVAKNLKAGGYKLALISNLLSPFREPFLNSDLFDIFDVCIFSCDVRHIKPDRMIYEHLIRQVGYYYDNMLMIGDNLENDYLQPKKLRMEALHLKRNDTEPLKAHEIKDLYGVSKWLMTQS